MSAGSSDRYRFWLGVRFKISFIYIANIDRKAFATISFGIFGLSPCRYTINMCKHVYVEQKVYKCYDLFICSVWSMGIRQLASVL